MSEDDLVERSGSRSRQKEVLQLLAEGQSTREIAESLHVVAEQDLRDREARLASLLQQVPALVWTTDLDLKFTALQGGILGGESPSLPSLGEMVEQGRLGVQAIEAHRQALQGQVESYEVTFGDQTYSCRIEPRRDAAGAVIGVIGVALDISEAKAVEAQRRRLDDQLRHAHKMEAMGRLAGGVAHGFNNLLTIIEGNAELLGREMGGEPPLELVEIRQAAASASALTRQLLTFTRQQHIQRSVFELDEAVAETCKLLVRVLGEDVRCVHIAGSDGARIEADRSQIHQMLLNLAINASDAMPGGGKLEVATDRFLLEQAIPVDDGALTVGASVRDPSSLESLAPGDYVRLRVTDEGVGMDEATLERLFEPFFSTKRPEIGTGLGLATVHGMVRQAGGCITVESRPGSGTTFTLLLPLTSKAHSSSIAVERLPADRVATARLMLVEDEPVVRRMLARGLTRRGYQVVEASGGEEALRLAAAADEPFDVLVTDVLMPDMKGPELARRLRHRGRLPRLLFISGYTDDALQSQQLEIDYLQKPFTVAVLAQRLEAILVAPPAEGRPQRSST